MRGSARRLLGVCAAVVAMAAVACTPPPSGSGSSGGMHSFDPAASDPAIKSEPLYPSFGYNPTAEPRGRLAVLFNGTGAGPLALARMGAVLAADGFHVIGLRYESSVGTQAACPDAQHSSNPDCHRRFRSEVTYGAGVPGPSGPGYDHAGLHVSAANSVLNRLQAHVEYLHLRYPTKGWEQFQVRADGQCAQESPNYSGCALDWSRVALMGHSQGAGVALYLSKQHQVSRVGMLSGAYDAYNLGGGAYEAAPWVDEGGFATPMSRVASFSHLSDPAIGIHRSVADALGLPGPEVLISAQPRPYGQSRRLVSSATPGCLLDSAPSHNSTATDLCAPGYAHDDAWRYLASGE